MLIDLGCIFFEYSKTIWKFDASEKDSLSRSGVPVLFFFFCSVLFIMSTFETVPEIYIRIKAQCLTCAKCNSEQKKRAHVDKDCLNSLADIDKCLWHIPFYTTASSPEIENLPSHHSSTSSSWRLCVRHSARHPSDHSTDYWYVRRLNFDNCEYSEMLLSIAPAHVQTWVFLIIIFQ